MRGQRVNHGSSLTVPLLSSLHTVNQHSYRHPPPPPHRLSYTCSLLTSCTHTHIHTHSSVLYRAKQQRRYQSLFISFDFFPISCEQLRSDVIFANVWMCFSLPCIYSDSHRKKGRERAQRNKNVKGIARKAHRQWSIRGRMGREWERRDGAEQLLCALWGSNCLLLWESGNSTPPTGGLVTWWEWKKGRKTQRRSEGGAQRCRERNGRTGKRKTGWIVNIKTGSPQYEWVL